MHEKSLYFWGLSKGLGPHTQVFPVFCPFIRLLPTTLSSISWSGRRVSNPQPPAWKAGALPIELLPLKSFKQCDIIVCGPGWIRTTEACAADLQSAPFGHSGTDPK